MLGLRFISDKQVLLGDTNLDINAHAVNATPRLPRLSTQTNRNEVSQTLCIPMANITRILHISTDTYSKKSRSLP